MALMKDGEIFLMSPGSIYGKNKAKLTVIGTVKRFSI
jgi:hypothetical protein